MSKNKTIQIRREISYTADFTIKQAIDVYESEEMDTQIEIDGSICVGGNERKAFLVEFEELCDKYRI